MDNLIMDNMVVAKLAISIIGAYLAIKVSTDKCLTFVLGAITYGIIANLP